MATVNKIKNDLVRTIDLMKKNIVLYQKADSSKQEKYKKIAGKLTKKKKQLEAALEDGLESLYADAELELNELRIMIRKEIQKVIIKEAGVFDAPDAAPPEDQERDVAKLQKKFEGPIKPIIGLINTKDELHQVIQLVLNQVEANKPGLGRKAKILLKKTIQDL